jgi:hypothetical protein
LEDCWRKGQTKTDKPVERLQQSGGSNESSEENVKKEEPIRDLREIKST